MPIRKKETHSQEEAFDPPEIPIEVLREKLSQGIAKEEVDKSSQRLPISRLPQKQRTVYEKMLTDEFTTKDAVEVLLELADWLSEDEIDRLTEKFNEVRNKRYHEFVFGDKRATKAGMNRFLKEWHQASQSGKKLTDQECKTFSKCVQHFRKQKGWELYFIDETGQGWQPCSMSAVPSPNKRSYRFKVFASGDRSTSFWAKQGVPPLAVE